MRKTPLTRVGRFIPRSGTWTVRNNMQRGPSCEEDPALPVLFALIKHHSKKSRSDFFE
jgi:hypothetical protein